MFVAFSRTFLGQN